MSETMCDSGYDANWCDETLSSRRLIEPKAYAGSLLVGDRKAQFPLGRTVQELRIPCGQGEPRDGELVV
jgi:hypothetical protein